METEHEFTLNVNNKDIYNKAFTAEQWTFVEKVLNEDERKRNEIIANLGDKIYNIDSQTDIVTIGEYLYQQIRPSFEKILNLSKLEKSKTKFKINKKTQIILDNTEKIMKTTINRVNDIIKNIDTTDFNIAINNIKYIEFRIIILMAYIDYHIKKINNIDNIEEISIASHKIYDTLIKETNWKKIFSIPDLVIELSSTLITDFRLKVELLDSKYNIKLFDIANRKPKLIYSTLYDNVIPMMNMQPYPTQIELINIIKENMKKGFMIFYKTLPGLGKTSMILALCHYIKKEYPNKKIIFCCSDILETVRLQVLRIMYNFKVKFGIAIGQSDKAYKITNSWNCKNDKDREMIVADYISTYLLLEEDHENEYILFFDEPTINTHKDTAMLQILARILYNVPKHIILSSATLPSIDNMNDIINHYKQKYQHGVIEEVISNKTLVGCSIKDFDDNIITPHHLIKTPDELTNFIIKIKKEPLIGKFYTLQYLINLNHFMERYSLNLNLGNIHSFNHENVIENIIILLEKVTKFTQKDFDIFKKIGNNELDNINDDNEDYDLDKIIPNKFLTQHAFKYVGGTLIACNNPFDYVKEHFFPEVEKFMNKMNIKSIHNEYEKYSKQVDTLQKQVALIHEKFKTDDKIDDAMAKIAHIKPTINFPINLQINTPEHIKLYAKYVESFDNSLTKNYITPESIDITDYHVDDRLKFLLYMGVGIYTRNMPNNYNAKVLEMLNDKQLAFIVADETFCYGANYQISNVIIYDDLCDQHSVNTILQLIGRTGRVGKSWYGRVFLDNNTCNRLKEFIINTDNYSVEANNIINTFNKFKNNKNMPKQIEKNITKTSTITVLHTGTENNSDKENDIWDIEKDFVAKTFTIDPNYKLETITIKKSNPATLNDEQYHNNEVKPSTYTYTENKTENKTKRGRNMDW